MNDKPDDGDWLTQMHDMQADLAKRAVNECNRLRRRVAELQQQIAASPATMYELQERVTQLETLLNAAKGQAHA